MSRRNIDVNGGPLATGSVTPEATLATLSMPSPLIDRQQLRPRKSIRSISVSAAPTPRDLPSVSHLSERLLGDVLVGSTVTAIVAPFLSVVDKALVERSAGSATLVGSAVTSIASMARNPVSYLKSPAFGWMWMTYAATYSTANALRTLTEHQEYCALKNAPKDQHQRVLSRQKQTTAATLFVGTSIVNSTASVVKDRAFSRMYGSAANAAGAVPRISYAMWMSRDFTVIGSSFILPEYVAAHLQKQGICETPEAAASIAQIGTPVLAQIVAGPLHFVGLDCYNRNLSSLGLSLRQRVAERFKFLAGGFVEVVAARMIRILPGYGIAGVGNKKMRAAYREQLISRKIRTMMTQKPAASSTASTTAKKPTAVTGDLVALIRANTKSP